MPMPHQRRLQAREYAKAIIGAIVAGLTSLTTSMADGGVTAGEWLGVAVAVITTFGAVFGVENKPHRPR